MVSIRLSSDSTPEQSAVKALGKILGSDGLATESGSLHDALKRLCALPKPETSSRSTPTLQPMGLVLVFDQFEELFVTFFRNLPKEREKFGLELAKIIYDETLRVYIVLSLRSEYFHHLNEFRAAIPSIFQNNTNLELRPFDDAAALRVINGPAERQDPGFAWQKGLPERIVSDLKILNQEKDGVLPIHLQIVCYGLFEHLPRDAQEITHEHYESAANNSDKVLGQSPADRMIRERIIGPLDAVKGRNRRRCLYQTLGRLITPDGTKILRSFSHLRKAIPEQRLVPILKYLEERLLLRLVTSEQETWYELRHDYLAFEIKPWLEAKVNDLKASELRRRGILIGCLGILIGCLVVVVGIAKTLFSDWNTYTAHFLHDRPDELVLARKPGLGFFSPPSLWDRKIGTGFPRSEIQAGDQPNLRFEVNKALSSWENVEPFLQQETRWALQLATRLGEQTSATPPPGDTTLFESIRHHDIGLYAAADERVLQHVMNGLKIGNPAVKGSAADALGALGVNLPQDQAPAVVQALFNALENPSPNVKSSAADALGALGVNLPQDQAPAVVQALLDALKDQNLNVKSSAADALVRLVANLPKDQAPAVVETLLNALKDQNPSVVKISAADALRGLGANVSGEQAPAAVEALLNALKDQDSMVKSSAAEAMGALGANLPKDRALAVVKTLLKALKDRDFFVKSSAADALGELGADLPNDQALGVVQALLNAPKNQKFSVKASVADALVRLGAKLPKDQAPAVVQALLNAIKDQDSMVKSSAADALGGLGANLPNDQAPAVVQALLDALKNQDFMVKSSAADALGGLGANLPNDQAPAVVQSASQRPQRPES
jgi:HEAT repeat protein